MKLRTPPYAITPYNVMTGATAPSILVNPEQCGDKYEKAVAIAMER